MAEMFGPVQLGAAEIRRRHAVAATDRRDCAASRLMSSTTELAGMSSVLDGNTSEGPRDSVLRRGRAELMELILSCMALRFGTAQADNAELRHAPTCVRAARCACQ